MATKEEIPKGLILRGGIYHLRFIIKGEIVAESTRTGNLRAAIRILEKRKSEMVSDLVLDNKRVTRFHAAIDKFVATRSTKPAKANASYALTHFKTAIDDDHIKRIELNQVQDVVSDLNEKYAKATVALVVRYWNSFVNWCIAEKYHICGKIKNIKVGTGRTRWLTPEEQTKLLYELHVDRKYSGKDSKKDAQRQDNYDMTVMLLDTGLRFMEAGSMHWNQVDFDRNCVYVTRGKGGIPTTLTLTTRLRAILERRKALHPTLVFPTKDGVNRSTVWMGNAVRKAGISIAQGNITPHVMRHTFAATMIQNGISLPELQHLLGHKTIEMTQRYSHFRKQDATDKAAEIMNKVAQDTLKVAL